MPPMATTEPPAALSSGQAARQSLTWAKNFSAKPACQSASVCSKKSPRREAPALLTRISSRPKRCSRARRAAPARPRRAGRRHGFRRGGRRADSGRDLVKRGFVARGQQQIAAGGGKFERDALADAAASAGHQRDLARRSDLIRHRLRIGRGPSTGHA